MNADKVAVVKEIVESTKGKIFSVVFVKASGELRHMTCRTGVKRDLKGGVNHVAHKPNMITVFDVEIEEYRNINAEAVTEMTVGGTLYGF
jgi:hypothetical protein